MNILLIGSGGREHALAWKLKQSPKCTKLYCAPGNAGIAQEAEIVNISVDQIDALVEFTLNNAIDFVVVGPEAPLVDGLADKLRAQDIPVFGPSQDAAQLEGSKGFMKDLCKEFSIPTAAYERFTDIDAAIAFIQKTGAPIVVKADGLAAGKGVIVAMSESEAIEAVKDMLSGNSFGASGSSVVIEEFMEGEELSFFALTDGEAILPLTSAQDHKRVFDGDKGPNTGGMGAYSPGNLINDELEERILTQIIQPTVDGLKQRGTPYSGVLYAGLMIKDNQPKLIEYNARFGDPECQAIMMRLETDLVDLLLATAQSKLATFGQASWSSDIAMCVVMAAQGYPGAYEKNTAINGLEDANKTQDTVVFHAGTAEKDGKIVSIGGRVLGVTSTGADIHAARDKAYSAVDKINWPQGFCRRDIGWRAL